MVYLDHNATSPVLPQVLEGMLPFFAEQAGNPSSVHRSGRGARQGVDEGRRRLAALLAVHESQIVFTSGGTEANNLALMGCAARRRFQGHVVISAVEHASLLKLCERLNRCGMAVTQVGVDDQGRLSPEAVQAVLRQDTVLVSILHANNETGVIQPLEEIAQLCHHHSPAIPVHTDAVQSVGKVPICFGRLGVDMLSLSAHKFGGPKGVGALVVEHALGLEPLLLGGGQERGRRAGTENVPSIVGCGLAAQWAQETLAEEGRRLRHLQQTLEGRIQTAIPDSVILGQQAETRLANTSAILVPGIHGETVVMNLDLEGIAVSSGSACSSGRSQPSHVPVAMGVSAELATSMVRVSLGWNSTAVDVDRFVVSFVSVIKRLRQLSAPATQA
ncbi:MAG: cysteine desulfurase [Magnetococcales bacterium]|nr:cysteine desulfurase [Magnetococcales bacterium]